MAKPEHQNEIIAHEWTSLRLLWEGCKASVSDEKIRAEIEAMFPEEPRWTSAPEDWHALNLAEQRVGAYLDATRLAVEYQNLLDIAFDRKIASLARYQEKAQLFDVPAPNGVTLDQRRAVYLSLLQMLQSGFVEARFHRRLHREAATRLFYFGLMVIGLALLPMAVYGVVLWWTKSAETLTVGGVANGFQLFSSEPGFGLAMVATFGILGAYFSRLMSFQSKLATLRFNDGMNLFQWGMLLLRLVYGMIGAVIFYYVLRAGLLGGTAFPELSRISIGEQLVWKAAANGIPVADGNGKMDPGGLTILAPTTELAKLLVWSFIAGFSERLIPDMLERTEAQAKKTDN